MGAQPPPQNTESPELTGQLIHPATLAILKYFSWAHLLYEAIRAHIIDQSLSDRISKVGMRLHSFESRTLSRLEALEGTVQGLERRTGHKAHDARLEGHDNDLRSFADRLSAIEARLENLPKPRPSRAKPKPLSKTEKEAGPS